MNLKNKTHYPTLVTTVLNTETKFMQLAPEHHQKQVCDWNSDIFTNHQSVLDTTVFHLTCK